MVGVPNAMGVLLRRMQLRVESAFQEGASCSLCVWINHRFSSGSRRDVVMVRCWVYRQTYVDRKKAEKGERNQAANHSVHVVGQLKSELMNTARVRFPLCRDGVGWRDVRVPPRVKPRPSVCTTGSWRRNSYVEDDIFLTGRSYSRG